MCKLLDVVRERGNFESNNKIALALGVSPELVSRWNTNKSEPNGINTLKLMKLGNISRDEALKYMQSGFASVSLIFVTAFVGVAVVALYRYSHMLYIM